MKHKPFTVAVFYGDTEIVAVGRFYPGTSPVYYPTDKADPGSADVIEIYSLMDALTSVELYEDEDEGIPDDLYDLILQAAADLYNDNLNRE